MKVSETLDQLLLNFAVKNNENPAKRTAFGVMLNEEKYFLVRGFPNEFGQTQNTQILAREEFAKKFIDSCLDLVQKMALKGIMFTKAGKRIKAEISNMPDIIKTLAVEKYESEGSDRFFLTSNKDGFMVVFTEENGNLTGVIKQDEIIKYVVSEMKLNGLSDEVEAWISTEI